MAPGCAVSGADAPYNASRVDALPARITRLGLPLAHRQPQSAGSLSRPEVFVSDALDNVVNGYDQATGNLVIQLTGLSAPRGLASDAEENLYVADSGNQRVLVFAPGSTQPFLILDDLGWYPTGVAVSGDGEVAVTNNTAQGSFPGSVTFYKKGRSRFFRELYSTPLFAYPYFCAYDARGNLYLDAVRYNALTSVVEIARGARTAKNLKIRNIRSPGGLTVDSKGELLILDQYPAKIYRYALPSLALKGTVELTGAEDAVTFALVRSDMAIYDADSQSASAGRYAFPSGGGPTQEIMVGGLPIGVAVTPWSPP